MLALFDYEDEMTEQTLVENPDYMYRLTRTDDGSYKLYVVCGGIAMYEVAITLIPDEVERYHEEGPDYIRDLAYLVAKNDSAYRARENKLQKL